MSKLIKRAEAGEDVYITKRGKRLIKLTPFMSGIFSSALKGKIPPFDESLLGPMSDKEAEAFHRRQLGIIDGILLDGGVAAWAALDDPRVKYFKEKSERQRAAMFLPFRLRK